MWDSEIITGINSKLGGFVYDSTMSYTNPGLLCQGGVPIEAIPETVLRVIKKGYDRSINDSSILELVFQFTNSSHAKAVHQITQARMHTSACIRTQLTQQE